MLQSIHFLLTYTCNYECDHCFLYCGPRSQGTFTLEQIRTVLAEARKIDTVESVCFEGGEPLLFYPLLAHAIRAAHELGFKVGLVTNGYMSTSVEDAGIWLKTLIEAGLDRVSLSDDSFHSEGEDGPASRALAAVEKMEIKAGTISIDRPTLVPPGDGQVKGEPVIGGGALFKGRAVEKLTQGLPRRNWLGFTHCPHENLEDPGRVHVDSFGHVHLCQGLSMGNMWETPLAELVEAYRAREHPVCGALSQGGPAELVRQHGLPHEDEYVDECHLCFLARKALLERYPRYLAPRQVYGLEQ